MDLFCVCMQAAMCLSTTQLIAPNVVCLALLALLPVWCYIPHNISILFLVLTPRSTKIGIAWLFLHVSKSKDVDLVDPYFIVRLDAASFLIHSCIQTVQPMSHTNLTIKGWLIVVSLHHCEAWCCIFYYPLCGSGAWSPIKSDPFRHSNRHGKWSIYHLKSKRFPIWSPFKQAELDLAPPVFPYTPVELNVAFVLIHSQIRQTIHSSHTIKGCSPVVFLHGCGAYSCTLCDPFMMGWPITHICDKTLLSLDHNPIKLRWGRVLW